MSAPVIYFDLGNTLAFGPTGNKQPFDDAVATIEALWWRGYRIGLLSDQSPGTTEQDVRQKLEDYGLESFRFDVITISSEFNPPVYKPDPQIFEVALNKAGFSSAGTDTVFVTESLNHIEAARALGWRAIHKPFQSSCTVASGECIDDLDELLNLFPQLPVDSYIRDATDDSGDDLYTGNNFWNSPDLWIRNQEDSGVSHQNPEFGQDNWFYVRVHNRGEGIVRAFIIYISVKEWLGTQFVYPGDYQPYLVMSGGGNIEPGDSAIFHYRWDADQLPAAGTHVCWLTSVQLLGAPDSPPQGAHAWEHNNLAQKNLAVVDLHPGDTGEISVVLGSRLTGEGRYYTLELHRSSNALKLPVSLKGKSARAMGKIVRAGSDFVFKHPFGSKPSELLTRTPVTREKISLRFIDPARVELSAMDGGEDMVTLDIESGSTLTLGGTPADNVADTKPFRPRLSPAHLITQQDGTTTINYANETASVIGIGLQPQQIVRSQLKIALPEDAVPGERYDFDLIQRNADGEIEGGISVAINVLKPRSPKPAKPRTKKPATSSRRKNS